MKMEGRLGRKGVLGDALYAVMCGAGPASAKQGVRIAQRDNCSTMSVKSSQTPAAGGAPVHRQILALLGNRTVVFGSAHDRGPLAFSPERDSVVVPRVTEVSEIRLAEHLKVDGYQIVEWPAHSSDLGDLMLQGHDGSRLLIELKLRGGSPRDRERDRLALEMATTNAGGVPVEVWRFSSDRLSLEISSLEQGEVRHETLVPLNVWETTSKGIFDRERVLDRITDWERRLTVFFAQIAEWVADQPALCVDQTRTVTMSEELMRNFGVPDRELPILDVLENGEVVASFIPRALWIIGADGRVDLITRSGTDILVYSRDAKPPGWQVADRNRRTQLSAFDKQKFSALLETQ